MCVCVCLCLCLFVSLLVLLPLDASACFPQLGSLYAASSLTLLTLLTFIREPVPCVRVCRPHSPVPAAHAFCAAEV